MIACRKSFTDTLLELARQDKDIVAVTTDARGSVTLGDFAKELPAQFVECGIAEQDAVGISAGLAHSGKKVFGGLNTTALVFKSDSNNKRNSLFH